MMNINNYGPRSVNLGEEIKNAPKYKGTITELKSLVDEGKIVLTKLTDGTVTGFWIESGLSGLLDNLAGENFNKAYCCKPVMEWLQIIMDAKYKGPAIESINEETQVINYVDGSTKQLGCRHSNSSYNTSKDLPNKISFDDLGLDMYASEKAVRRAIKNYTGYFVAKDCNLSIEDGVVSDIEYGRKASSGELD